MIKFQTNRIDCYPRLDGLAIRVIAPAELESPVYELIDKHVNGIGVLDVTISKPKKKRSLTANAYLWVLCDEIARAVGTDKESIYKALIRRVGVFRYRWVKPFEEYTFPKEWAENGLGWFAEKEPSDHPGLCQFKAYFGSSSYSSSDMAILIDEAVSEARDLGINTKSNREIKELKGDWNEEQHTGGPVVL